MGFKSRGVLTMLVAMLTMSAITATAAWASGKPFVETKPARSVSTTEALLNGIVNPNGAETKYHFEYGTTTSYGKSTAEVSIGSGTKNLEESKVISSLTSATTYHFRIVATNSNGTTDGSDAEFTTKASESGCHIKAGSTKYGLCIEGVPISTAAIAAEPESNPEIGLFHEIAPEEAIHCGGVKPEAEFDEEVSGSIALKQLPTFTGCKLGGFIGEECQLPESTFAFYETRGTFGTSSESITVRPATGENLWTVSFDEKNHCTFTGRYALSGRYECKLHEPEVEKGSHKETCEGTQLTFDSQKASIKYSLLIWLAGSNKGHKFSIYEH